MNSNKKIILDLTQLPANVRDGKLLRDDILTFS